MMNKQWFGPRKFGFGYTPVSWEGWLIVSLLATACAALGYLYS